MLILLVSQLKMTGTIVIAVVPYNGHWVGWSKPESSFTESHDNNNVVCSLPPKNMGIN